MQLFVRPCGEDNESSVLFFFFGVENDVDEQRMRY
jgi:hypothetical protein